MSMFLRRFLSDPGAETLLEIESVNILDLEPPASITGIGSGTVLCVGEFENGPFTQYEVTGASDFARTFGSFGFTYDGVQGNNPCARSRRADAAVSPEFWNGNGFVQLANKKFKRLILQRIDTSVGSVSFTRLASLLGAVGPTFALATGDHLDCDPGGTGVVTGTFTGAIANYLGGVGAYPTLFTGGEKMNVTIDNGVTGKQIGPITIYFEAADQSQAQVISRINAYLGFTCASDGGGGKIRMVGRVKGTGGDVTINSIDAGVTAKTGLAAGPTAGTGNVFDLDAVTVAEVHTIMHAASVLISADTDIDGRVRLYAAVSLTVDAASTATGFGFTIPDSSSAAVGSAGVIPAGFRVRDAGGNEWVTMQDVTIVAGTVTVSGAGPYSVKVRPATDDGSAAGALAVAVNVVPFQPDFACFTVQNPASLSAAKTESQIDAAYVTAIGTTKALNKAGKQANFIISARQSNIIRSALRQSALEASSEGCYGRKAVIRPPLSATRATMRSSGQPGVGAYRDQRVYYSPIGHTTFISQMTALGAAGGAGYADDGIVNVGADSLLASVMSQLPPEENPGQENTFMSAALGLVDATTNPDVQDMTIVDYTLFKSAGCCALIFDDGMPSFQSGKTSVDPLVHPNLQNISRRNMADFLQDSIALRLKAFGKKGNTRGRRAVILAEINAFLDSLKKGERIDGYKLTPLSDAAEIARGMFRIGKKVRTISSLDSIVLESTVGEGVVVEEQ